MLSLEYLAGFFDGEGSVSITKVRPKSNLPYAGCGIRATVTNTYRPVLQELHERFGGNINVRIRRADHHKQGYEWQAHGSDARNFLSAILPYLNEKYQQVVLALTLPNDGSGNKRHVEGYKQQQEVVFLEVKRLKHTA